MDKVSGKVCIVERLEREWEEKSRIMLWRIKGRGRVIWIGIGKGRVRWLEGDERVDGGKGINGLIGWRVNREGCRGWVEGRGRKVSERGWVGGFEEVVGEMVFVEIGWGVGRGEEERGWVRGIRGEWLWDGSGKSVGMGRGDEMEDVIVSEMGSWSLEGVMGG